MRKAYVSMVYELNGKEYALPVNHKFRELWDFVHTLNIKTPEDEDDMQKLGYISRFAPAPDVFSSPHLVEKIDAALGNMPDNQAEALFRLCDAFKLDFDDIDELLQLITTIKERQVFIDDNEL